MLFVLIGLWMVGLLLIVTDPKRPTTRWISSIAFTGGCGGLSAVIADKVIPAFFDRQWLTEPVSHLLLLAEKISSLICYYGLPYTFLMFTLSYHPHYSIWQAKRRIAWILLVPVLFSFAFTPKPEEPIPYVYVSWWAAGYILAGIYLLISALVQERNSFLRRSRLLTTAAAAPALFFAMFTLYLLPAMLDVYEWWRYNVWVIAFTLAVIVASSFRYGFMGLQISIQNQRLGYTLRAITSGTSIMNHGIKNDVGKIRLFSEKIKSDAAAGHLDREQITEDIEVILAASQHIYDMIYRIQGQTQDVVLVKEEINPAETFRQCLRMLSPELRGIDINEEYSFDGTMLGDRAHLVEVWTNILTNAMEAMPSGGRLTIRLTETKRKIVLEIRDTGSGMDKQQLKRAFDPFYTTKSGKKMNFGLGLSYCYNIIQKHHGSMNIHSKPGVGTSVFMQFPKKKRLFRGGES